MIELDVAIVGGGVSGAYTAWRLSAANPGLKVGLFELSERIGGRLHSVTPLGMRHLRAEVGGMRFLATQPWVRGVIEHLGLATRPFFSGPRENFFHLRGQTLHPEDWTHPERVPYRLEASESGRHPGALLMDMVRSLLPQVPEDEEEWLRFRQEVMYHGCPLRDLGMWNLVLQHFSIEACHMIEHYGGYDTRLGNHSAAEFCALLLRHDQESQVVTLVDGMQALPLELVRQFRGQGGQLFLGHGLQTIDPPGDLFTLHMSHRGGNLEVRAAQVVLGLPRRSLELLDPNCYLLRDPQFLADLRSVKGQPACKHFLGYRQPWWREKGLVSGRSVTDLPIRQCYYFGCEADVPGGDPQNTNSLLMAGYNDGTAVEFWEGMLPDAPLSGSSELELIPPPGVVNEVHRQVSLMHGCTPPEPYMALMMDWSADPYGGGYHLWRVHSRSWEIMPRMRQPHPDQALHVVGEAWSQEQGWIEGALVTAETVLQEKFGLAPPSFGVSLCS